MCNMAETVRYKTLDERVAEQIRKELRENLLENQLEDIITKKKEREDANKKPQ